MEKEYPLPTPCGFTIYSKTGCTYCEKVKAFLTDAGHEYTIINCDEILKTNKIEFLEFIESIANIPYNTFPMVFHNKNFVGGYTDTVKFAAFL